MSESDIVKNEQPNPDDVLAAIQSFNDPSIITGIFAELGWSYSVEIRETLAMAKQNANLSIKFKAVKHLRALLREAAESAGYIANVSSTTPNPQGGSTTFSARRISGILNPIKQIESIEIKEPQNGKQKPESYRKSNRKEGQRPQDNSPSKGTDTLDQFPHGEDSGRAVSGGDASSGGLESTDGGETPEQQPNTGGGTCSTTNKTTGIGGEENPCIQTRPPTCDRKLFPGISAPADGDS